MRRVTRMFVLVAMALVARTAVYAHCTARERVLSVADYDGDGSVTAKDVKLIVDAKNAGRYAAFFDVDLDGALTPADVAASAHEKGDSSSLRDRQLAQAFWAVEKYRDQNVAIGEGWIPVAEPFNGIGVQWGTDVDGRQNDGFHIDKPEGLLYSYETGELVGIAYTAPGVVLASPSPPINEWQRLPAPASFEGADATAWHHRTGACWQVELDYFQNPYDPTSIDFSQCLTLEQCTEGAAPGWSSFSWVPDFHIMYVWLFALSECGTHGSQNLDVDPQFPLLEGPFCSAADVLAPDIVE